MPFKKVGNDRYVSPSGRHFNGAQVRLWYANGEKFPGQKEGEKVSGYAKGGDVRVAGYAQGGPVLGRTREFMKEPDPFRQDGAREAAAQTAAVKPKEQAQTYPKGGAHSGPHKTKSVPAVKPRG